VSDSDATRTSSRTSDEQAALVRAFVRKFNATVVPNIGEPEEKAEQHACVLCKRTTKLALGADGRWWCKDSEAAACNRIAQSRLGGATGGTGNNASLRGVLREDGKCRSCGAPIKWVKTQRGKKMPVDTRPAPAGVDAFELMGAVETLAFYVSEKKRALHVGDVYRSHFQTCPDRIVEDD
jgi:hypothetical protein